MGEGGWIWQVFVTECARTKHPQRIGDIRLACVRADAARAQRLPPRAVERLLDERARTGKARILGLVAGLRSGGRRLYWPAGSEPPSEKPPANSLIEITIRGLRANQRWARGEPFSVRALVDWLRRHETIDTPITWHGVYTALRNLARRKEPLVRTKHDANGTTMWMLHTASPHRKAPRQSPINIVHLITAHTVRSGCPAVTLREIIAALDPWERGELRRILHHLDHSRTREKDAIEEAEHVCVGRLDGSPVLALTTDAQSAREALSAGYAIRTLHSIRRRIRFADVAGMTVNALCTRERLQMWLPELREAVHAAQAFAFGVWAETLATQLEYCAALANLVSTLRVQNPSPPRCLKGNPSWWMNTASAAEMLQTFAGAPRSRQTFRPLLARWHVLRREGGAVMHDHQRSGDPSRWDAIDTYVLAHARLGKPEHKARAKECLRYVGIGRPDPDDARWSDYIKPHERAGLDFYRRAVYELAGREARNLA